MYIYNSNEERIIFNRFFLFKKEIIFFFSGKINENEFKIFRLQNGLYRQSLSYMYRISIPYGILSFKQVYLISYLSNKFDKNYLHVTTRTNIQYNWTKIINILDLFYYLIFTNLHSIQTSGNCIRNITINYDFFLKNFIDNKSWSEILRQWFNLNSEFLFLPRKFKISLLSSKNDNGFIKVHDLGILIKKNLYNNLCFNILIGGGLGRTPLKGLYILKYLHWKNIINYCDKIVKLYNINGYRDNIYKARIKILLKFLNLKKICFFIKNENFYFNNFVYLINEREINKIFCNMNYIDFDIYKYFFNKKIKYNFFFINWLNFNINFNYKFLNLVIVLNYFNSPPGDLNFFQLKILFYLFIFYNKYFFFTNRQNVALLLNKDNIINIYNILKDYFFFIYNYNSILDIICCPGKDFCSLANSESISLVNYIQNFFKDYNSINKLNCFTLNISGCINSCAHHHLSNLGFLGIKRDNNWYQLLIGGDNNFNNLLFSTPLGPSLSYKNALTAFLKFLKIYLKIKKDNIYFIDIYNKFGFNFFKNYIYGND